MQLIGLVIARLHIACFETCNTTEAVLVFKQHLGVISMNTSSPVDAICGSSCTADISQAVLQAIWPLSVTKGSHVVILVYAVMFRGLPTLVDMRDRQVLARFLCHGCISHIPGDFRPEWVSAQLLLYEDPKPMFSVLYNDPDDRYRHMMDFQPVPLPCKPFLTWPQHVQSED